MTYRIDKQGLLDSLSAWNGFLKRKVHLVACGGTALTLLDIKASTKDVDLLVVDMDDCMMLMKAKMAEIDVSRLSRRFKETASYDVSEDKANNNMERFIKLLKKEGIRS